MKRVETAPRPVRLGDRLRLTTLVRPGARVALISAGATGLGALTAVLPEVSAAAAALFAFLVLTIRGSPTLAILATGGAWLGYRLPGSSDSLSVADSLLIAGAVVPLLYIDYRRVAFRWIFMAVGVFVAAQLPSMAHAPSLAGAIELGHRVFLIVASVLVGAFLIQNRRLAIAVQGFLAVSCGLGAISVLDALSTLHPAYPLGLQKNYAGDLLAVALVLALVVNDDEVHLGRWRDIVVMMVASGLVATFSRGGLLAVPVGLLVYTACARRLNGRVLVVTVAMAIGAVLILTQLADLSASGDVGTNNPSGSLGARQIYQSQAIAAWQQSPLVGSGIRYYLSPGYAGLDPHNVVLLELGEAGDIGLAGFVLLVALTAVGLIRSRTHLGMVALSLLAVRLTHGMADIYWVHGTQTVPWIIVGGALAGPRRSVMASEAPACEELPPTARTG